MPFSRDSFMIEKPYTVKLMPPPVSEAGLGRQLPESKASPKRAKPTATAILNVRFLIRHEASLFSSTPQDGHDGVRLRGLVVYTIPLPYLERSNRVGL